MLVNIYQKINLSTMENYRLEIKNSEGGDDSKLLVNEMFNIYTKVMVKNNFNYKVIEQRKGLVVI